MSRPLTEIEEQILRKHVSNVEYAMQTAKALYDEIGELEKKRRDQKGRLSQREEDDLRGYNRELSDLHDFLRQVAFIRREVLLHMHLDKLEGLGLSYPEVPAYLRD